MGDNLGWLHYIVGYIIEQDVVRLHCADLRASGLSCFVAPYDTLSRLNGLSWGFWNFFVEILELLETQAEVLFSLCAPLPS